MWKDVRAAGDGKDAALQGGDIGRKGGEGSVVVSLFWRVGKAAQFMADQPFLGVSEVLKEIECRFPDQAVRCGRGGAIARS